MIPSGQTVASRSVRETVAIRQGLESVTPGTTSKSVWSRGEDCKQDRTGKCRTDKMGTASRGGGQIVGARREELVWNLQNSQTVLVPVKIV